MPFSKKERSRDSAGRFSSSCFVLVVEGPAGCRCTLDSEFLARLGGWDPGDPGIQYHHDDGGYVQMRLVGLQQYVQLLRLSWSALPSVLPRRPSS